MYGHEAKALAASIMIILTAGISIHSSREVAADPIIISNPDGTSDAVWNFTNPADYNFSNTEIVNGNVTLEREPAYWWNSTTLADFSDPESMNNVTVTTWPGDIALTASSAPPTKLTIQPGVQGEDTYLDWNARSVNYGSSTIIALNGQARPVFRFNLSAIPPGVVIDSAVLSLYQTSGEGNFVDAGVYHFIAEWNENQANWDYRMTGIPWITGGGDYDSHVSDRKLVENNLGWKTWNITQMVDLWYRNQLTNLGFILVGPNPGPSCNKIFFSSEYAVNPSLRPKIDILYRGIGVAGEYVSEIGGPGFPALWKDISWNPEVKDLLSDEFNGVSLNPKWIWTNPPAAYDVGVTRPGSLHIVSGIGIGFEEEIFSGVTLSQYLVGDFIATMKFNANPTEKGQETGFMVVVDPRNWYSIGKENVNGVLNWRAEATDDGITVDRALAASGNPVPAWVRIERSGETFTASTSTNGNVWQLRDTYTPALPFSRGLRVSFYVSDGFSGIALPVDVDYIRFTLPGDATIAVQTRIGNTTPVDSTWSSWSPPYSSPVASAMSGGSSYIQYRLSFWVATPGHIPMVGDVNISWFYYPLQGFIETNDLVPGNFAEWGDFTVIEDENGQTISYEYSLDSGANWTPVDPPQNMKPVSTATGRIRFRANLATVDMLVSPLLTEMRLTYTQGVDHFYVAAPPSVSAGSAFAVTVTAKNSMNGTVVSWTGTAMLAAVLQDGTTPGGGILGITSISISAGGTETLTGETYTKAETIRIFAYSGLNTGLSDDIAVSPGPVNRISIDPDNITILALASQMFTANAYDAFDNVVTGANFSWTVTGGVGSIDNSWGQFVLFTASPPAASGTLQAANMSTTGIAQIFVTLGEPPWVKVIYPTPGAVLTGVSVLTFANSSDAVSVRFDYHDGTQWILIGITTVLDGTFYWDTSALDFRNGILLATATNALTAMNQTVVTPIEVDNTPPIIVIRGIVDNQAGNRTLSVTYTTDPDVVRVDLTYFDGIWHAIGSESFIDGYYLWIPGVPINGVTLRLTATDHAGLIGWNSEDGVGSYTVGPSPPTIAPIPELHVHASTTYRLNLTLYISDPDTPLVALAIWDSDPSNVVVNPGDYPSLDITYSAIGTFDVTLWASDGVDTAWAAIKIISGLQWPPILIGPIPMVTFNEDTIAFDGFGTSAATFFSDPDGDELSFFILGGVNVSSRVNADGTVDFWASLHWHGTETLCMRAMDPIGGFADGAFLVFVRDVNHPPDLVVPFAPVSLDENSIAYNIFGGSTMTHFEDPDGDPLAISLWGGVNISAQVYPDGTVDMWGAVNWSGSETLWIRATDPFEAYAEGVVVVTVIPANHVPILTSALPDVSFNEDAVAFNVFGGPISRHFFDRDGDILIYSIYGATNVNWRINLDLTVDMWAKTHWWGQENLIMTATDENGTWVEAHFLVTVWHVNHAPILVTSFPSVSFYENSVGTNVFGGDITAHFFDIDGDYLTIIVLNGNQIDSRINVNGTVDLWATTYWSGAETLRIRAMDPSGLYAEGTFLVTVKSVDQPPILAPIPDIRIDDGATFTLNLTPYITDVDTEMSDIVVTTDSQYVTVNGTSLTLAYPRGHDDTVITVTVSDGEWTAFRHVRVTFVLPWWNDIVVVTGIPLICFAGLFLAAGMLFLRRRWRPAKAFVLDGQLQPIREFTPDQRCDVTYDEVVESGVLDAIEKSVRIRNYNAQAVWGSSMGMVIIGRGPISREQIGFASDMLANVHDKSEDAVLARIKSAVNDIKEKQMNLSIRSRAFAGTVDATNAALSKLAIGTVALQAQSADLANRESILKEKEAALAEDTEKLQRARTMFEARRKEFENLAVRFEEESRRRMNALKGEEKAAESVHQQRLTKRKSSKRQTKAEGGN